MAASPKPASFFESSEAGAADHELQRKLENASSRHLDHFAHVKAEYSDYEEERSQSRRIKEHAIARLDELIVELTEKLKARGCTVFAAATVEEARDYIVSVARNTGARRVVKGKSMTTEEIGLNPALENAGMEVLETDLGEYIVQLRQEPPSHIIAPAIHLMKEQVEAAFRAAHRDLDPARIIVE